MGVWLAKLAPASTGPEQHTARKWMSLSIIAESERRAEVSRDLYSKLLHILAKQRFNAASVDIALPNADCVGLHERLGFRHIGTFQ